MCELIFESNRQHILTSTEAAGGLPAHGESSTGKEQSGSPW